MIVDDHGDMRRVLKSIVTLSLGQDADTIIECDCGEEAVLQYEEHLPDFILMDLQLKHMDGFETIKKIRSRNASAEVIMVTSFDTPSIRLKAKELNVREFVNKENLSEISHILKSII